MVDVLKHTEIVHAIDTATLTYENGRVFLEKTLASSTKSITMNSNQTLRELFAKAER